MLNEKITGKHGIFIAASFCAYFVLAIPLTVQGSIAPVTMEYYGINAAQQGLIMTMQSIGSLGAGVFLALLGERYNKINVVAIGILIISIIGATIAAIPTYIILLLLVIVMGVGNAIIDIMMNSVITDVYPKQKNTLLPFVHGFFSTGATVVPIIVTRIVEPTIPASFSYPFRVLAITAAAIFALFFISGRRIKADTPYIDMEATRKRATANPAEIFKTKTAWFFIVVGILYFTFQVGIMMWLPTFAIRNVGADFETAGMMLTAFFGGSLVMRFLGPLLLRKLTAHQVFTYFGWASAISMFVALFSNNITLMLVLVVVSGFLQGSNVATLVLMCGEAFPGRTASAASIYALANNIVVLTTPLWMGVLSEYTGFLFPLAAVCVSLLVSSTLVFFHGRKLT